MTEHNPIAAAERQRSTDIMTRIMRLRLREVTDEEVAALLIVVEFDLDPRDTPGYEKIASAFTQGPITIFDPRYPKMHPVTRDSFVALAHERLGAKAQEIIDRFREQHPEVTR